MTLTVESLGKWYGNERALADVSFSVADGEFCVVVGPSGCGKTTLLHCIAGLVRPDEGEVRRDGRPLRGLPLSDRGFGVVFQDFEERLFPHMTVEENVAFGLRQSGIDDAGEIDRRVGEVLRLLAIEETRDDHPPNLSGGQQQRVELARQLARDSRTLLLDDPLSDLDYKLQKRLELELRRLQDAETRTFVYVTHNQAQSLKLADKMVVMNHGKVEQVAPPDEVYWNPATAFVARFIGDSNLFRTGAVDPDGSELVVETPAGRLRAARTGTGSVADDGVVVVRPEDVSFGGGANDVTGTLEQRVYTGETTEFIVSVTGVERDLRVQHQGNVALEDVAATVGDEVTLTWAPADTIYFPPEAFSVTDTVTAADLAEV